MGLFLVMGWLFTSYNHYSKNIAKTYLVFLLSKEICICHFVYVVNSLSNITQTESYKISHMSIHSVLKAFLIFLFVYIMLYQKGFK